MKHVKLFEAFEDEVDLPSEEAPMEDSPMDAVEDMPAALPAPEEEGTEEGEMEATEKDPVLDALDKFKSGKISGEEAADMIENSL